MALKELDLSGQTKNSKPLSSNEEEVDELEMMEDDEDDNLDEFFPELNEENIEDDDVEEEEDDEEDEETYEEDEADTKDADDGATDSDEEDDDEDGSDEDDAKAKEGSDRYNKRIREVITQRNAQREETLAARKEAHALKIRNAELQKEMVESNKALLAKHNSALKSQIKAAHDEGDITKAVELQEELMKATTQLQAFEAWTPEEIADEDLSSTTDNNPQTQKVPLELQVWVEANPWFSNPQSEEDQERIAVADAVSRVLLNKGLTYEDAELYEQVDSKLNKLGLAKGNPKVVKSTNQSSETDVKPKKTRKKVSQTVQGASRTTPKAASKRKSRKITLDAEQKRIAKTMGISYKEYADELLRIESSKNSGERMTPLKL